MKDEKLISETVFCGSSRTLQTHLAGIFATILGASADHVLCDPEVVEVPAVGEDVHIHSSQYGRELIVVEGDHAPAADCAYSVLIQRD